MNFKNDFIQVKYNILILGKGAREHALAWKIKQSPLCGELFAAKGNAGTSTICKNVDIDSTDFPRLKHFSIENSIDIIMVGSEDALVEGIWCEFKKDLSTSHIRVIGPSKRGALLEGSKSFAKGFMEQFEIPTAKYSKFKFDEVEHAKKFLGTLTPPYVLKADGLAGGKGVIITESLEEAESEIISLLEGRFGESSKVIVIEEFLNGEEFSVFVATDGSNWTLLPTAKDYKRVGVGNTGPNTGGMGAISPPQFVDDQLMEKVVSRIIEPTLRGLNNLSIKYTGFIFFGLINVEGNPYVIEYNCRLGDPESEAILPRIKSDFVELMLSISDGNISNSSVKISDKKTACVFLTSSGYPNDYTIGKKIQIESDHEMIFHSGTKLENSVLLTDGGRVMAVVGEGYTLQEALGAAYDCAKTINYTGKYFRSDIGA